MSTWPFNVGQKVPIVNSTFQPIAAGGVGTQPIVKYTLTDIGIIIKITPRIHHAEKEVTLEVELAISSIAGEAMAGIPIIANREIKNTVRLKDGQTNLLAGLLRDEERRSLGGIVGLKDLPLIGSLFSSTQTTIEQTDVILTITPHILRSLELSDEDMKPLWVDPESLSGVTGAGGAGQEMREGALAEDAQAAPDELAGSGVYLALGSARSVRSTHTEVIAHPDSCHGDPRKSLYMKHKQAIHAQIEKATCKKILYVDTIMNSQDQICSVFVGHCPDINGSEWRTAEKFFRVPTPQADVLVVGLPIRQIYGETHNPILALTYMTMLMRTWINKPVLRPGRILNWYGQVQWDN